jgi:hypothetical protein
MGSWRYYLLSDDAYIATSVPPRITYDKIRCMTVSYWGLVPFHTQSGTFLLMFFLYFRVRSS